MILPAEIRFNFCIFLISFFGALLYKNSIFFLFFDKVMCLSRYNFFFLNIWFYWQRIKKFIT